MTHRTKPIVSQDDVPEGYVQLARVVADFAPNRGEVPVKTLHKLLSDGHRDGLLPAVKLFRTAEDGRTGPVFVERAAATKLLHQYVTSRGEAEEPVKAEEQPVAVAEPVPCESLDLLRVALEQLTAEVRNLKAAIELRSEAEAFG
jgi:hypothetical protein